MKLALSVGYWGAGPPEGAVELVKLAERLGFDSVWSAEAYGSDALGDPLHVAFIRAPRFRSVGAGVEVLGRLHGEPVLVRQGQVLAGTFHPELTGDGRLHGYFLELTARATARTRQAS